MEQGSPPSVLQNMLFKKDLEQDACSPWRNNALGYSRSPMAAEGTGGWGGNGNL